MRREALSNMPVAGEAREEWVSADVAAAHNGGLCPDIDQQAARDRGGCEDQARDGRNEDAKLAVVAASAGLVQASNEGCVFQRWRSQSR